MHAQEKLLKPSPFLEAVAAYLSVQLEGMTRKSYGEDLSLFYRFLDAKGLADLAPDRMTPALLAEFRDLELKRTSTSSCLRRMAALSSFFTWATHEGFAADNPVKRIKLPPTQKPLMDVLTKAEILRLLRMPDLSTWRGARDRAILSVAYYTGVRISELIAIKDQDLLYGKGGKGYKPCLHVVGKGGKSRNVPIAAALKRDVEAWLSVRPASVDGYLFVTESGTQITEYVVRHALIKYSRAAKIEKNVTPHTLRHTFATHQLESGVNIKEVQADLGHVSLVTTEKYLHFSEETRRRGVDKLPSLPPAEASSLK